ncbi:hypothetical protein E3P81_00412 [Wallemia ichthyophaga]|uniref:Uncharacterized protein n=1 Tax=Wallemia ichthyophaga TaxID=245174 RepID=A0A4T0KPB8_WALIC|nr:hypothetical protein E3P97_00414 [Wallemia ichthyophaga]TIA95340.1 hypothetical protein E3P96_03857 [Wallemia ichthyophaga]TIB35564.1 hypothetical protein E3P85_00414 [Wallemia ichthyophaga]TIB39678.1 hypothetical protein E3P86_01024 [Wallemia ichthyophaga]TIB50636.1 hypothetical protein E3P82_00414 [Wallemia ichthyophaga]
MVTSYDSPPLISPPFSKKKRKLSPSSLANNPITTKRKGNESERNTSSTTITDPNLSLNSNPVPPTPPSHPPDIVMATETLHMHDTSMRDSTSLIDNDKKAKQRKIRFTMGPRADCHKCKLGVKGHYSHFE